MGLKLSKRDLSEIAEKHAGDEDGDVDYRSWAKALAVAAASSGKQRKGGSHRSGERSGSDDDDDNGELSSEFAILEHSVKKQLLKKAAEHDDVYSLFRSLDKDGSGALSDSEFARGLKKLGCRLSKKQSASLLACFDVDGDGTISYSEFLRFVTASPSMDKELTEALNFVRKQFQKLAGQVEERD